MIQIEAVRVREFRGIRDLELTFNSESYVVWGPNGSGKSGIVDAIEFALTGEISRLAGRGSGTLSVLHHGPHVHRRDDPALAIVDLTVKDTSSGKTAVLTRNVKTAKTFVLAPDHPEVRAAVEAAQAHPELTLSRRDVIKFILAEPGSRSQEVQALLKLDRLESVRSLLRSARTKTAQGAKTAKDAMENAQDSMQRHLDLPALLTAEVTDAMNARRKLLGLPEFEAVVADTNIKDGVEAESVGPVFNKASALRDVQALAEWIDAHPALTESVTELTDQLSTLDASPDVAASLQTRGFIESGLQLATDATCPLCDLDWPAAEALQAHLREKIAHFNEAAMTASAIQAASKVVVTQIKALRALVRDALVQASRPEFRTVLEQWVEDLIAFETQLGTISGISDQRDRLTSADPLATPMTLEADLAALISNLEERPDQTASAAARTFLVVAEERWNNLRLAKASHAKAAAGHLAASTAYDSYCKSSDEALTKLYQSVEDQFSAYYRAINSSDEAAFRAALDPSAGKLDLNVDFYGLGLFPPAAYHSEGHQDGMGICLYLALIRQLLGAEFRMAVLDDVVMSVDSNHRRLFCALLKAYFPDVQFIITTHDEIWARQMQSAGLIGKKAQARFYGWTVDEGPAHELGVLPWDKIKADLDAGEVPAASARLRRNLESVLTDLAANLHGSVVYRPEGDYDLGDLMSAVKGAHSKWLKQAAGSADSWNDDAAKSRIAKLKEGRSSALLAQEGEQWAVNSALHYNDWASFERADFEPVVAAWKEFLDLFTCANPACESWIYVSGPKGREDVLRCRCGDYTLNLLKK